MFSFQYTNRMETKSQSKFKPDPKLKLMDQVRQVLRYHHYAYRTEQTYCEWIVRFIKFHGSETHPSQMANPISFFEPSGHRGKGVGFHP